MRTGKTRTREHIIADYSGVHFEKNALDCGYSVERTLHDYGIDMTLFTYDGNGELESDFILVQLKATDKLKRLRDGESISLAIEWADLETWQNNFMIVILVLYNAPNGTGYWVYVQQYLEKNNIAPKPNQKTHNVRFDATNILDSGAIRKFAAWKNELNQRNKRGFNSL